MAVFTRQRLLALVVACINGVLGAVLGHFSQQALAEVGFALLLSLPGLVVIWFQETLGGDFLAFPRGIPRESPPVIVAVIGWFYLVVIPMLYIYKLSNV